MSTYNIEMNTYNGSTYDQLYPQTLVQNINDFYDNVYSKSEVDSAIQNELSGIVSEFSLLRIIGNGSRIGTGTTSFSITCNSSPRLLFYGGDIGGNIICIFMRSVNGYQYIPWGTRIIGASASFSTRSITISRDSSISNNSDLNQNGTTFYYLILG